MDVDDLSKLEDHHDYSLAPPVMEVLRRHLDLNHHCWVDRFANARDAVCPRFCSRFASDACEDFGSLLESFHQRFPNASYIQVSKPVVDFLHLRFGLYGTQFGSESRIDLSRWSLTGKKKQILRTALNQAEKNGITVKERFSDDHTREISEAWIRTRKCKSNEIRFLIRPMEMDYRENERHFYAYQDGKAVGFI